MSEATVTTATASSRPVLGALSALSVVLIWASWLVSTRHSVGTALTALDLSLLRYGLPALVLAPFWLRTGLWPRTMPKLPLVLMVVGSGAVFFQIVGFGMRHTPASAAGVLLPGTMPFFTALIGMLVLGEKPDTARKLGMAAILAGESFRVYDLTASKELIQFKVPLFTQHLALSPDGRYALTVNSSDAILWGLPKAGS